MSSHDQLGEEVDEHDRGPDPESTARPLLMTMPRRSSWSYRQSSPRMRMRAFQFLTSISQVPLGPTVPGVPQSLFGALQAVRGAAALHLAAAEEITGTVRQPFDAHAHPLPRHGSETVVRVAASPCGRIPLRRGADQTSALRRSTSARSLP
jgi:hypothetical protein